MAVPEQPLVTTIPDGDVLLPTEPETPRPGDCVRQDAVPTHGAYIPVSCIVSLDVRGFGRTAQAAWLLDQVFKTLEIPGLHPRLTQLQGLDVTIQTFLGVLLQQCYSEENPTEFCQAIAMTIRSVSPPRGHAASNTLPPQFVVCNAPEYPQTNVANPRPQVSVT